MPRPQKRRSSGAQEGYTTSKTIPELEHQVEQLEELLEERKQVYRDLCADDSDSDSSGSEDSVEEEQRLAEHNAEMRKQLAVFERLEKKYGRDPRVMDKRNLVADERRKIAACDKEIDTLMAVKKRRDKGLREIDRNEQKIRDVRERQNGANAELRSQAKELLDELRELEKKDLEAHERYARLQTLLMLGATEESVDKLSREVESQHVEIRELQVREEQLKKQSAGAREDVHRALGRERRECAKQEEELQRLRALLERRELELKRSYQAGGHIPPGAKVYAA